MGKGLNVERSPAEWFEEAARCYVEGHQACAWCGRAHAVFKSAWGEHVEYHCPECDFSACRDRQSGLHFASRGGVPLVPGTPATRRPAHKAG